MGKYPKIYFGPMSKNIIDVLGEYSNTYPIGLIPSRRQIEFDGGYVNSWTTKQFVNYVRKKYPKVLICRDHGGRRQGKSEDDGVYSLKQDCYHNFDIIHIDPWKQFVSFEEVAKETTDMIKVCLKENKNIKFEVGTEEAIKKYTADELELFLSILKEQLADDFDSVLYAVVQFGTAIKGTKNIGFYNKERALRMLSVCKKFGLMSKEHNGDYLTHDEMKERFALGLDAINIAPEFGVMETTSLVNYLINNLEFDKLTAFYNLCYKSNKWVKWLPKNIKQQQHFYEYLITRVCGHYVFSEKEILSWKQEKKEIDIILKNQIKEKIGQILFKRYKEK